MVKSIVLYGASRCHKTQFYILFFKEKMLNYSFCDVEKNIECADKLRNLYTNRKLNFPTITIDDKKLRNPRIDELEKWLSK